MSDQGPVHLKSVRELRSKIESQLQRLSEISPETVSENESAELLNFLSGQRTILTGKKSELAGLKKQIGSMPAENRAEFAQAVQALERDVNKILDAAENILREANTNFVAKREGVDVTLPGKAPRIGHLHPITILRQQIEDIFVSMGYAVEDDREIETDHYNFDALNIPEGHPARESQDTFYTAEGFALRSQTSTVQIRAMERRGVPIRIIAPGKVYRRDTPDMTHVPMFHQVEGLCVDTNITMAHLKGTVTEWLKRLFGAETKTRFRPSYFPFTEPSAEFDFSCFVCKGSGRAADERCRPCKGSGWIELGGCGMVHPNVLQAVGVNPKIYSGFAFGFGLERMAAMMFNIDDIRRMFENDIRFLEQFR